jgi:hypothetical protein
VSMTSIQSSSGTLSWPTLLYLAEPSPSHDRPFFRPDISQVATDRASVMRCRWSSALAVGRCCCCHRCCQPGAGPPVVSRPVPCRGWPASARAGSCLTLICLSGVSAEAPGSSVTLRVRSPGTFTCARCPAVTVTLETGGRTRTLSGPSSDLTSSVSGLLRDSAHLRQARSRCLRCCPGVAVMVLSRPPHRARTRLQRRHTTSFELPSLAAYKCFLSPP